MVIFLTFVNVASGEKEIPAYIDADTISKWYRWQVPEDLPIHQQNTPHRSLRGKTLTVVETSNGQSWCDEPFWELSARILAARGQNVDAAAAAGTAKHDPAGRPA